MVSCPQVPSEWQRRLTAKGITMHILQIPIFALVARAVQLFVPDGVITVYKTKI